jgi:recombination protein RecA
MFGSPETTPGGNALKFYASVRLDVRRIGALKDGDSVCGNRVRIRVVKNKVAPPFRDVELEIIYGHGISRAGEILDIGLEQGVVEKSGSWYSMSGTRLGQGREQARAWLDARPALMSKLHELLLCEAPDLSALGSPEQWDTHSPETKQEEAKRASAKKKAA